MQVRHTLVRLLFPKAVFDSLWVPGFYQCSGEINSPCAKVLPAAKRLYGAKAPPHRVGPRSCPASILCGQDKKQAVESTPLGVRGPQCSVQRSLRVAAKAAPLNSLAHWASASLHPPLAALGSAPPPLGFPPTPKRQRKNPAFRPTQPRPVHHPEKGGSDREPLRGRLQPSRRAERAFFRRGAATE